MDTTPSGIVIVQPLTDEEKAENLRIAERQRLEEIVIAQEARRQAYVRFSDPIYMQWKRGLKTEQEWLDAVAQVEKDYPVPVETKVSI